MTGVDFIVPLQTPLASSVIAEQLRERIVDGTLGALEHINEAQLAARYNVSRGPVREAVQRLVQEGLLKSTRNRGTSVVDLGPADIEDVYMARAAIERQSARLAMAGPTDALVSDLNLTLAAMAAASDDDNWPEMATADLRFHQTIVNAAGSQRLSKMFSTLAAETILCIRKFPNVHQDKTEILPQHQRLLDLIVIGNLDAYLTEIDAHMNNSVIVLTKPR